MPAPHSLLSSWPACHFYHLSCMDVTNPFHCASSRATRASKRFPRCPTLRCSSVSCAACCRILLFTRLLESLEATGAWLLQQRFPFQFLSISSNMVTPGVSAAQHVAVVAICIAISIGAQLLLSPASPASRLLLSRPLYPLITSVRLASLSTSSRTGWLTHHVNGFCCQAFMRTHSAA